MDTNQNSNNKKDTYIKSSSEVANAISQKPNPTSKVTHRVKVDDPYADLDQDIFERSLNLDDQNKANTAEFELPKKDEDIIPSIETSKDKINDSKNSDLSSEIIDEGIYQTDDEIQHTDSSFMQRLRNSMGYVVDNEIFDTFSSDSKRRIMIIIGIIFAIILLCLCALIASNISGSNFVNIFQNTKTSSKSTISTIDEDVNKSFDGIWGDLSGQISQSSTTTTTSTSSTKETIKIKKDYIPYEQRSLAYLSFDGTDPILGNFILYKQFTLSLKNYDYSSTNKSGSTFMNKYGWTEGVITTLSGTYNNSKYTINQVLSRMPAANASAAVKDAGFNFNYVGCKVFELENTIGESEEQAYLYKVVCYDSNKYKNDTNGFLVAKFAKNNVLGIIDIIGKNDLDLLKSVTKEALKKFD